MVKERPASPASRKAGLVDVQCQAGESDREESNEGCDSGVAEVVDHQQTQAAGRVLR